MSHTKLCRKSLNIFIYTCNTHIVINSRAFLQTLCSGINNLIPFSICGRNTWKRDNPNQHHYNLCARDFMMNIIIKMLWRLLLFKRYYYGSNVVSHTCVKTWTSLKWYIRATDCWILNVLHPSLLSFLIIFAHFGQLLQYLLLYYCNI